ncbi:MAG TPA: hypothetical protein VG148_14740 [Pyrinomonadaceae bacterium]|nr:hypothetical protein [Pyrinomonadaceae bacterium]
MASSALLSPSRRLLAAAGCAALALLLGACAAATSGPGRPRGPEAPYPVLLTASDERRAQALAGWAAVLGDAAATSPTPELRPVTATPVSMPAGLTSPPRMPRVIIDEEAEQSEEETRESLRRFIASAPALIGSDLRHLSLVEIVDAPGGAGAKLARYQQRPFHYPLRGGFGEVEITFTPDLRVTALSSTAIPDADRLRPLLRSVTRQLTAEQAAASLAGRGVTYTDAAGNPQTRAVAASEVTPRELVIFPVRREGPPPAIELHYAWEFEVGGAGAPLLVYIDAVNGQQLAAAPRA